MKLISNHKEWIDQAWIDYAIDNQGERMPKDYHDSGELEHAIHDVGERMKWFDEWGIDPSTTFLERFDSSNFPFSPDFSFLPEPNIKWGILKYKPGQFMPLHSDDVRFKNERRLWMPLQDYVDGHITLHSGKFITEYSAGDLFWFDDPNAIHGAANISGITRLVFTIVAFP